MDPITAIGLASTAFAHIKKAIDTGKEIQEVTGEIGKFFGAVNSFSEAPKKKNPFRKLLDKGSVEQEALETVMHRKKLEQMESELREMIVYTYGLDTYREMIALRRKIKIDRELEEKKALLDKKEALQNSFYITLLVASCGVLAWVVSVILENI